MKKAYLIIITCFLISGVMGASYEDKYFRDDDYNPQGESSGGDNIVGTPKYNGYINRLEDYSDQLEISDYPDFPEASIYRDSVGDADSADQYAITKSLRWSISNRGTPYPPGPPFNTDSDGKDWDNPYRNRVTEGGTYYRKNYDGSMRNDDSDPNVRKTSKVFANSFAAVAGPQMDGISDEAGNTITEDDGIWVDPDDLKKLSESNYIKGDWSEMLVFNIDITGPDSGLGLDTGSGINHPGNSYTVMYGNIYWEGEEDNNDNDGNDGADEPPAEEGYTGTNIVGETVSELEPPVCGDDRNEYLVEEIGESTNSQELDGQYACSSSNKVCVDYSASGSKIFSEKSYKQTDEPGEDSGRLKDDKEVCYMKDNYDIAYWWDQDYGIVEGPSGTFNTCNSNSLYGSSGVRWFNESQVEEHPNAFTGGIDDDANPRLENSGVATITSRPEASSWSDDETPVSSGTINTDRSVVTKGFCGGDDKSEYLVTQRCNTDLCETDNSIKGVAKDIDHCLLDQEEVDGVSGTERELYAQGDLVDINKGSETRTIACYNGEWHKEWPVVFLRDNINVSLDTTNRVSFQVINVKDEAATFDLNLNIGDDDLDPLTTFGETGTNEMTARVAAGTTKTYNVKVEGNTLVEPAKEVELQAGSRDGELEGTDNVSIAVTNQSSGSTGGSTQETRDVPGIGMIQVIWLMTVASVIYFFTGRNL